VSNSGCLPEAVKSRARWAQEAGRRFVQPSTEPFAKGVVHEVARYLSRAARDLPQREPPCTGRVSAFSATARQTVPRRLRRAAADSRQRHHGLIPSLEPDVPAERR